MMWELPTSLNISGVSWNIRSDYRAILDILTALSNPDYEEDDKILITLTILYPDFDKMPSESYSEALEQAYWFIDGGKANKDKKHSLRVMDWEQDAHLYIPAINRVMGREIRALEYLHWWTFLGAYSEIGECSYSQIVSLRSKKAKGKKLEKWEREFMAENKDIVELKVKLTEEEQAEQDRLDDIFGD